MPPPEKRQQFEQQAVPAAAGQGLGVVVMKVVRPRETIQNLNAAQLIRYALSLADVTGAVIGIESLELLEQNLGYSETLPTHEGGRYAENSHLSFALFPP